MTLAELWRARLPIRLDNVYGRQQTPPKNQWQIPAREIAHETPKIVNGSVSSNLLV
jgi:hypothetical protein